MHLFRYRDGIAPNLFTFIYMIVGYPVSLYGLAMGSAYWYVTSILLLAHSLVIAAYLIFLRVLGFMDAFQHIYEVRLNLDEENNTQEFDRDYEEKHTWSNLLSEKHEWINLLVLNFCYHNVHHYRPGEPWCRLPRQHAEKYSANQPTLALNKQLQDFHRYRSQRLLQVRYDDVNYGAAGVSFLAGV